MLNIFTDDAKFYIKKKDVRKNLPHTLNIFFFTDVLGGDVGVAVTSCIFLTGALQYGMRQSAETENLMTSVERVMEYGQIKSEADLNKGQ